MSLDSVLSDARQRGELMVDRVRAVAPGAGGGGGLGEYGLIASAASMAGGSAGLGRQTSLQQHQEQYRHFTGWPFAAIRPIAQRIAGQPIRAARMIQPSGNPVVQRGRISKDAVPDFLKDYHEQMELLDSDPILDAIANPNPIMTSWTLKFGLVSSLELTGKHYWWVKEGERGQLPPGVQVPRFSIWPLPSSWVEPRHDPDKLYANWLVRPEGSIEPTLVPGEEIVYFSYPDPSNPLGAVSPLQAEARAVVVDEGIQESQRRSYANGIWPGVVVKVGRHPDAKGAPGQRPIMTKDQRGQLMAAIKQAYRGVQHFDEPMIVDGLIEDVQKMTQTPRELDWLKSATFSRDRVCQGFGTSPFIMGQVEGGSRNASATADDHFCNSTVNPKISLISQCMTAWLPQRFGETGIIIYIEPARATDVDFELQRDESMMKYAGLQINERRRKEGLPPLKKKVGNCVLVPTNYELQKSKIKKSDKPGNGNGNGGKRQKRLTRLWDDLLEARNNGSKPALPN